MIHLPNFDNSKDPETMLEFTTKCSLLKIPEMDSIFLDANEWIRFSRQAVVCSECLIKIIRDITIPGGW